MIKEITVYDTAEDLERLTGLTHEELWDHGFNLDDMDCGFCSDVNYCTSKDDDSEYTYHREFNYESKDYCPFLVELMLDYWMPNWCVGFSFAEYNGKYYYTLHHA